MGYLFHDKNYLGKVGISEFKMDEYDCVEGNVADDSSKLTNDMLFDEIMEKKEFQNGFASACGAVMAIATKTGMSLDDVFDMYVSRMKKELESDDTKIIMAIGGLLLNVVDKLV